VGERRLSLWVAVVVATSVKRAVLFAALTQL
jgi:hypothetical protein